MITKTRKSNHSTTRSPGSRTVSIALGAIVLSTMITFISAQSMAQDVTRSPENAMLEIISPKDGDTVTSPVVVQFGLVGMGVAPAGVTNANTGHHHLIIDAPLPDLDFAIPKDANHQHFGGGQTQVSLDLAPGQHTLQLLLGDYRHIPHDPPISSKKITITVK